MLPRKNQKTNKQPHGSSVEVVFVGAGLQSACSTLTGLPSTAALQRCFFHRIIDLSVCARYNQRMPPPRPCPRPPAALSSDSRTAASASAALHRSEQPMGNLRRSRFLVFAALWSAWEAGGGGGSSLSPEVRSGWGGACCSRWGGKPSAAGGSISLHLLAAASEEPAGTGSSAGKLVVSDSAMLDF